VVDDQYAPATESGLCGTHHAGGTGADYDDVEVHGRRNNLSDRENAVAVKSKWLGFVLITAF